MIITAMAAMAQNGSISGKLVDAKSGEELIGVSVSVEGTSYGAASDFEGKFLINNLKPGTYNLNISYVAYKKKQLIGVVVKAKEVTPLGNITLEAVTKELNEVVIKTEVKKENSAGLLIQQKNAATISDGISADNIRKTPDRNTSDVLKRVSGASIQDNKFAIIRGLNERYTTAYLNGAPLPSSESDRKAFSFDIFPSNLLDNLVILKTATPDMPGEFGGGIIEINTKSVPDNNFQSFGLSTGYNSITTFKDQVTYQGGKYDFLGIDDGTRALPSGIPSSKNFPVNTAAQAALSKNMPNDWATQNTTFAPNIGMQYSLGRVWGQKVSKFGLLVAATYSRTNQFGVAYRKSFDSNEDPNVPVLLTDDYADKNYISATLLGVMANFSYKINTNHQITLRNLYSVNTDDRVIVRDGTAEPNASNPLLIHGTAQWFTSNKIYTSQLTGTHYIVKPKLKVNWVAGYSNVMREIPNLRRNSYTKYTSILDPENPNANDTVYRANVNNSSVGPLYGGNRFYSTNKEYIYSVKGDVSRNFDYKEWHLKNTIKVGAQLQDRNRDFTASQYGMVKYLPGGVGSAPFPDSLLYLPQGQIFSQQYIWQQGQTTPGFAVRNNHKPTDSYTASSKLYAGFIMFDNRYKERYRLIWGARLESFEQRLNTTFDNGKPFDLKTVKVDILPSVNFVYAVTESQNLRLSYSQTVNRPEFRELAPFAFYDFSTMFVTSGNEELKRALINNYDVRYEWYPGRGQVISATGFYKYFTNPIEQTALPSVSKEVTYNNADYAHVYGLEAEFRMLLGYLTGKDDTHWLNNYTIYTNVALIKSEVRIKDENAAGLSSKTRSLQGQSPYIVNSGLQYFNPNNGWSLSVSYNKVGQRIYIVGNDNEPNIWENGRDQIDAQVGKTFLKNKLDIRLTVKDLLAQKQYFFQDNNDNKALDTTKDNLIWVNTFGRVISLNVSYKF